MKSFIDSHVEEKLGFPIDDEKANALLKKNKSIMVSSAPGSGKSLCLLYKLFILIRKEKIDPNKILVLSFNRSIANQLKVRAREQFGLANMNTFFTFHSLSYRILNSRQRILYDQKSEHQYLSLYVQKIVRKYLNDIQFRHTYTQLKRLTTLSVQFIGRMNKSLMSEGEIKERIGTLISYRAEALTHVGLILRKCYERKKREDNMIDFDDVVKDATKLIHTTKGMCNIKISGNASVRVKDIQFILIDEGQDISAPFYNLIQAIRQYNPNLRLFVVGDKNQACNAFMGADVKYLDRFLELFEDSSISYLTMNYRSQKRIVDHANLSMRHVIPMRSLPHRTGGEVIEIETGRDRTTAVEECIRIINANHENSIVILVRTNYIFGGMNINDFLKSIKKQMAERLASANIRISTIHAFKGSESEIVILLKTKGHFPLLHRERDFFKLFSSETDIIEEERRLLYVALTRPRERLFIIK